ncbi:amino acid ABC transporter permease [Microbacterium esteraromaticum]|uniref:Amino acid ABC transporter permease n=1 Tax=Microbacterium esteraromaticum TaxID=57043 RepID=A0A939DXA4_9MICO|nr:amino acid ABC transporter permease [Microbacterium esteraromaticum]MBN8207025.1 amino acid ABC transporter permease [Microbacterium esteraromaticum]MBN8417180.1 amino acid ABC transporter permease [Microbacterium esteraromaticum]MBN8425809.1 amino acid ABC transporter permease [Microbacterium esteraromaticum]WDH77840.1 amino acid ABC transporter permease [Microbacterium esteraromaticum]
MTSVLYDVPGPRAIARNRVLAAVTVLLVLAVIGFMTYRLWESGQFEASKWYVFTFSNVWMSILEALGNTLAAFALAAVLSLVLGLVLAIGRLSDHAWIRVPVTAVTELLRAVPVLVMMMLLYYGLPVVGVKMEPYWAVVLALMAYNGSVLAEVFRAGIESLPRGQKEAGYAIGLRKSGVMRLILFPQAVRAMLPVIVAQLVVTMKDTALGFIITYPELLYYAKLLSSQQGRPILQSAFVIGGIYIVMCLILSGIAKWLEIRTRRSPKDKVLEAEAAVLMHEGTDTELLVAQGDGKRGRRLGRDRR